LAVAEYQHILYNEWLPIILGKQYMATLNLFPLSAGYSRDYDPSVDPRINNEFAAAGMRFGHSLIPGLINVYNRVGQEVNPAFRLVLLTPKCGHITQKRPNIVFLISVLQYKIFVSVEIRNFDGVAFRFYYC
jgi:hypothetical protein